MVHPYALDAYDGLGRKVSREEDYWQDRGAKGNGPSETGLEHGQSFTQGNHYGQAKNNGPAASADPKTTGNGKLSPLVRPECRTLYTARPVPWVLE